MDFVETAVDLDKLLFDPNNFRFQERDDFVYADNARFHEEGVQTRAYQRLKQANDLKTLKASLVKNTFISSERIIVSKYSEDPERYLVIEGNRRVAAARWIQEDFAAGVAIGEEVLQSINPFPVLLLDNEGEDADIIKTSIMGIRHISGIKKWGGYQEAKLLIHLRDELGVDAQDAAERVGLSSGEATRRYRAFKGLQQFQEDGEFGDHFKAGMYPIFHEALSMPVVRDWLDWKDDTFQFENADELEKFYRCISPQVIEEQDGTTNDYPPKINTYSHVRGLRSILANDEAKAALLDDPEQTYEEALAIAKQPEIAKNWVKAINAAKRALSDMSIAILKDMPEEDIELVRGLETLIEERLRDIEQLKRD